MSAPPPTDRLPPPEDILRQLAKLAQIDSEHQDSFIRDLRFIFEMAPEWHRFDQRAIKRDAVKDQLSKVEKAIAKLQEELECLDSGARRALGVAALRHKEFGASQSLQEHIFQTDDLIRVGKGVVRGEELLGTCLDTLATLRAGASSYQFQGARQGGAPTKSPLVPGNPNASAEDLFIASVYGVVARYGGHLTLDKNAGGGTSVEFFAFAAKYLPKTFRLKGLSTSRLQKLKHDATGQKLPPK
jgi:hypothetical protein